MQQVAQPADCSNHRRTRTARSVLHRLGRPSPPSRMKWTLPRCVFSSSHVSLPLRRIDLMSQQEVDEYLANLDEPKRTALQQLRQTIHSIVPEAEEGISYGMPAYRLRGKVIAGFAAFKNHLSYLPHSGSVLAEIPDEVAGYVRSKGALQFPIERPLPKALVKKLIAIRLRQIGQRYRDI